MRPRSSPPAPAQYGGHCKRRPNLLHTASSLFRTGQSVRVGGNSHGPIPLQQLSRPRPQVFSVVARSANCDPKVGISWRGMHHASCMRCVPARRRCDGSLLAIATGSAQGLTTASAFPRPLAPHADLYMYLSKEVSSSAAAARLWLGTREMRILAETGCAGACGCLRVPGATRHATRYSPTTRPTQPP
jgi:hypothetical protein